MSSDNFFDNKEVLVVGGTGLIGRQLIELLLATKAKLTVCANVQNPGLNGRNLKYVNLDLRYFENCLEICKNKNIVFNLAGIKGSPYMAIIKPASFFVPTLQFSINLMEAARICKVERFLFTSSIGVYKPKKILLEDDVWSSFPSKNDWYAGWAKRICELQAEAYFKEYNWDGIRIVRPANVYGSFDNFDEETAMVIPALISKFYKNKNKVKVWGDGSPIRDFIYSKDCAEGMIIAMKSDERRPINLGSGVPTSIKEVVETIYSLMPNKPDIEWDLSKPSGDLIRLMDIKRANDIGFKPKTSLKTGIKKTIEWYLNNLNNLNNRYDAFKEFN